MNFWWIKCKIVHTVLGHIKWSAIGLYFEDPVFFFLTMLHIWWFLWFVAAVFENTRTCVRKSRGKCFPSSRGRGENCSLCALLLLLILLSTLFSFPVTYKDGQSLLWKWSLFQWSACCQLLSVQFGSLIKSFFSHSNCCRICAKAIRKNCCQKRETTAACSWNAKRLTGTILYFISILNKWFCWCLPFFSTCI